MPSTRIHHSPDLTLRPRAAATSANTTTAPGYPDDIIPIHIWKQFQSAILQALTPFKEPRERVLRAILDMETKLGVSI